MSANPNVLLVDDDPRLCTSIRKMLESEVTVHSAYNGEEGLKQIITVHPALILLDLQMPGMSGICLLEQLRHQGNKIPVIIMTGYGSLETAVRGIQMGASDYIEKPFQPTRLLHAVRNILHVQRSTATDWQEQLGIHGKSKMLRASCDLIAKYAPSDIPVLLLGETGTGKEKFARAVHELSSRASGPFVTIDCSVLPESLLESELFGHNKGAFTGAACDKAGQLEWANHGTLFLDEIGNLPPLYQAKLLRFIQSGQFTPLGGSKSKRLDVRLVCATNTDIEAAIAQERFRKDLYYRIGGATVTLPPLRERPGDVEILVRHFANRFSAKYQLPHVQIHPDALHSLTGYDWPGNVRELEHTMERAVIVSGGSIETSHLTLPKQQAAAGIAVENESSSGEGNVTVAVNYRCNITRPFRLSEMKSQIANAAERQIIQAVRSLTSLNQQELAHYLSIDPKTLRNKLRK